MTTYQIAAFIVGFPFVIMAGGVIARMGLIIGIIALIGYSPIVGCGVLMLVLIWKLLPWFAAGLGFGIGERLGKGR
jgi:hypothetical protein